MKLRINEISCLILDLKVYMGNMYFVLALYKYTNSNAPVYIVRPPDNDSHMSYVSYIFIDMYVVAPH